MARQVLLTTTGTLSPVPINDLGRIPGYTHPTSDEDISLEYSQDEMANSADLQAAIDSGYITLADQYGNAITDVGSQLSASIGIQGPTGMVTDYAPVIGFNEGTIVGPTGPQGAWVLKDYTSKLERIVYVSKSGNDSTADGTMEKPYLTIKAANDSITDASGTNRYIVYVGPGDYTEDPITMQANVDIRAIGGPYSTKITASTTGSVLFSNTVGQNTLAGFTISGVTGESAYELSGVNIGAIVKDCVIYNCQTGIESSSGVLVVINIATVPAGSMTNLVLANGGEVQMTGCVVTAFCNITNVINCDNSSSKFIITGFDIASSLVTSALRCGSGGSLLVRSGAVNSVTNGMYVLGTDSLINVNGVSFDGCTNAFRGDGTDTRIELTAGKIINSTSLDFLIESLTCQVRIDSTFADFGSASFPAGYENEIVLLQDEFVGDEGFKMSGSFAVGRPDRGSPSTFGEGDAYTAGMVVITTDNTAGSTSDGGNLTDVSEEAASPTGSTFSFQGVTANHTILIGSQRQDASDVLKHWGIAMEQTTAAVEVTPNSFTFEYWDGSAWTEFHVMAVEKTELYRYAEEIFIRANSSEFISYGLTEDVTGTNWAKKTIDSKNLYWTRIRINTTITTAPVFQLFRIAPNHSHLTELGSAVYHGRSRFRQTIGAGGNSFGESGGVADWDLAVGSGGVPTGWDHSMKNSEMGQDGDAVYFQYRLPKGIDTSLPLYIESIMRSDNTGTSQGIDLICSVKPCEVQGVLEADPSGGKTPVARTLANTALVTNVAGETDTVTIDDTNAGKPFNAEFGPFDISPYYEGDVVFVRIELDDDGTGSANVGVIEIALTGVKWTHGGAL